MSVGEILPRLEIIPSSEPLMRKTPFPVEDRNIFSDRWRLAHFPDSKIRCPPLEPGGVVNSSHYCLHRTQLMPSQSSTRIGGEFRFMMNGIKAPKMNRVLRFFS